MPAGVLVYVLGVKAVGKSTLVREFMRLTGLKVEELSFGDFMEEVARREGKIKDREDLSKLPLKTVADIRLKAAAKIRAAMLAKPSAIIFLNTHGFFYTQPHHMLLPGSPNAICEMLKPDLVLLVEAEPREILHRRQKDIASGVRKREVGSIEDVKINMHAEEDSAFHIASTYGAPLKVFDHTKPVEKNKAHFLELVQTFEAVAKR